MTQYFCKPYSSYQDIKWEVDFSVYGTEYDVKKQQVFIYHHLQKKVDLVNLKSDVDILTVPNYLSNLES